MEPGYKAQVICVGQHLRIKGSADNLRPELQQKLKETHEMLVHASTCPLDLILEMNHVVECQYPKCYSGKVLWRHIFCCPGNDCLLCNSMRHIGMFHAGQCTNPNCVIPRCSEFREMIRRKERKARKIEKRLKRLRKMEREKKKIYDKQLSDSQLAVAAAHQLSLKEDQGDHSTSRTSD